MKKATKISGEDKSPTPTSKGQTDTESGSMASTKPTSKTLSSSKNVSLEEEAKQYRKRKRPPMKPKPMTSRIYLAGQAMSAIIARTQGPIRMDEVKRESFDWADYMLYDE